jgi:hypothetical protein
MRCGRELCPGCWEWPSHCGHPEAEAIVRRAEERAAAGPVIDLSVVLAGQPAGAWVVLDPDMARVLGSGSTPEEAIRLAIPPGVPVGKRPVLMQVPGPLPMY